MTEPETLTRDGVEVVIDEARAHVEHDAWLCRGTRRTMGVLLAEIERLRSLPVLPTCGECGWQTSALSKKRAVIHVCRKSKAREIDLSAAPPSWCELRGGER